MPGAQQLVRDDNAYENLGKVNMKVVVLTRFGLGQRSEAFFRANMPFLEAALVPSIAAQTETRFSWIIMLDRQAPSWVVRQLEVWKDTIPQLTFHLHDPFTTFNLMPELAGDLLCRGSKRGDYIVTVRVDADDALSTDYLATLRAEAERAASDGTGNSHAFISQAGALLLSRSMKFLRITKKNYSVVAAGSYYGGSFVHCYSFPHTKMWRGFAGVLPVFMESAHPHWLRTLRPGSVHRSYRGLKISDLVDYFPMAKLLISKVRALFDRRYSDRITGFLSSNYVSQVFGIELTTLRGAARESRNWKSSSIPAKVLSKYQPRGNYSLPQLTLKNSILERSSNLNLPVGLSHAGREELQELTQDFYSF